MTRLILAAASLFAASIAPAQTTRDLTLEQKTLLRCSAAFALSANRQEGGDRSHVAVPDLRGRGQEYFVRAMARLMDERGLDRPAITALLEAEAARLSEDGRLAEAMPPCLLSMEASGL